jgi:hypothetical protein
MTVEKTKRLKYWRQWILRGGAGASLFGMGLCMTIEAAFDRFKGAAFSDWFYFGTLSLIVTIAGLCLLIDSLRFKIKLDKIKKQSLL